MTKEHGSIELIIGPMFAGKTTELMRRVRRELYANRSCFVIKHARDTRYNSENVSSHDNMLLKATVAVSELCAVGSEWETYDVVAVDEGQFFPDVVEFCSKAADAGKKVIVSALDGDYRRQPFDGICRLIPLAESVKKLTAVCMECHSRPGSFTYRTVRSDQRELIGGADMYIATCRLCYIAKTKADKMATEQEEKLVREEEEAKAEKDSPSSRTAAESDSTPGTEAARKRTSDDDSTEAKMSKATRTELFKSVDSS